jgi:hypothetical protein
MSINGRVQVIVGRVACWWRRSYRRQIDGTPAIKSGCQPKSHSQIQNRTLTNNSCQWHSRGYEWVVERLRGIASEGEAEADTPIFLAKPDLPRKASVELSIKMTTAFVYVRRLNRHACEELEVR